MNESVLQNWVVKLPLRMQSTLILGLRGPDTHCAPEVKKLTRWLRGIAFKPGNPDNVREFMTAELPKIIEKGQVAKELEFCTQHFYSHLMHSFQVVAYCHPELAVSKRALDRYLEMCSAFHLPQEDIHEFQKRLGIKHWPGGKQPDTFEEAERLLEDSSGLVNGLGLVSRLDGE